MSQFDLQAFRSALPGYVGLPVQQIRKQLKKTPHQSWQGVIGEAVEKEMQRLSIHQRVQTFLKRGR